MTTRDTPFEPGTPCWVDLMSADVDRAKEVYGALFGWTAEDSGEGPGRYVTFSSDGHAVAGLMERPAEYDGPDVWSTYIATADVDATVAKAAAGGAQIVIPRMEVGDAAEIGVMAVFADPTGAMVGLWQAGRHIGFEKYNDTGSVTWDELSTKDVDTTIAFYTEVFGWGIETMSDSDDFRYFGGTVDGRRVAGILDAAELLPAGVPSNWGVYFTVDDVDSGVERLTAQGGTVIRPASDSPYGRVAVVADPTGAMFNLHGPNLEASGTAQ